MSISLIHALRMSILLIHALRFPYRFETDVQNRLLIISLLNRYSFSRSEIDYIIFLMSGQCEPIIDRFQVFRCEMSEKEIPLLKTENIYYDAPGKKCLLTESDLILLTFFHTLDDSAT
jgi:hypothetical protein